MGQETPPKTHSLPWPAARFSRWGRDMAPRQAGKKRDVDADARPRPQDRSTGSPAPRRQRDDSPPRQPRKKKRAGKQRSGFGKLIYWGAVLTLWAVIAAIGLL